MTKKCIVCGVEVEGIKFDGVDFICSRECMIQMIQSQNQYRNNGFEASLFPL